MISVANKSWKVICSYYACYDILYALFVKCGIKSEIHECSMSLMDLFDKFTEKDKLFLKGLKENRVYAQYYVNKSYDEYNIDVIKQFVLKVKELILSIKQDEILLIRDKIQKIIDEK